MLKKNKEMLRKIYEQEYAKASAKEEKARLERQIASIKKKAREDAKSRYNKGFKSKSLKSFGKKAKKFQKRSMDFADQLMGWS